MRILNRWTKIKRNGKCLHGFTWSLRLRGGRVVEALHRAYMGFAQRLRGGCWSFISDKGRVV